MIHSSKPTRLVGQTLIISSGKWPIYRWLMYRYFNSQVSSSMGNSWVLLRFIRWLKRSIKGPQISSWVTHPHPPSHTPTPTDPTRLKMWGISRPQSSFGTVILSQQWRILFQNLGGEHLPPHSCHSYPHRFTLWRDVHRGISDGFRAHGEGLDDKTGPSFVDLLRGYMIPLATYITVS